MKLNIGTIVKNSKLSLRRHGPKILVFSGVAGMVASAIMACVATRKLDPVLKKHREGAEKARGRADEKKEMTKVYAKTGLELAKLYGPPVVIGALSITGILSGNHIVCKRNVALATAYAALDKGYKRYRGGVIERFGAEVDKELRMGAHQEKIEVVETDENGKQKKVKKTVSVVDPASGLSEYARYFAYGEAKAAEPNHDYNLFFLKGQQELANHILIANGFLFLNEVYEMLGIERSIAGQCVGWVYDKNREDHGDNYVDFGIQEVYRKRSDEPGDYEKVYLLDFNVDGPIIDHAQEKQLITD